MKTHISPLSHPDLTKSKENKDNYSQGVTLGDEFTFQQDHNLKHGQI
jgi:hypothetical protein